MKTYIFIPLVVVFCTFCAPGFTAEQNSSPEAKWKEYSLVTERNIFSATRQAKREYVEPAPKPKPPEWIDCTGVCEKDGKWVAMFEGSMFNGSESKKEGKRLQGLLIEEITTSTIVLTRNGSEFFLPVGSRLIKYENKEWEVTSRSYKTEESSVIADEKAKVERQEQQQRSSRFRPSFQPQFRSMFEGFGERRDRGRR